MLSILGGIPWYLEQVHPGQTADDLIKQLCFEKDSLLVLEFDRIFHDLFSKIDLGGFQGVAISTLPRFEAHIGLQLELLLLQNRALILKAIGINPADVVASGPFRQSQPSTALKVPKGFATSGYFYKIVDSADFLAVSPAASI